MRVKSSKLFNLFFYANFTAEFFQLKMREKKISYKAKVRVQESTRRKFLSTDFQYTVNISYADIFRDLFLLSIVFYIHLYTVVHRIPKFSPFSLEPTMLDIFTVHTKNIFFLTL